MPTLKTDAERQIYVNAITESLEMVYFNFGSGGGYDIVTPPTEIRIRLGYSEYDEDGVDVNADQPSKEFVLLFSQAKGFRLFRGNLFDKVEDMHMVYPREEKRRNSRRLFFGDIFKPTLYGEFMTSKPTYAAISREHD